MQKIQSYIAKVLSGNDLSQEEMQHATHIIAKGHSTPAQFMSLLTAIQMKGITPDELCAAVQEMENYIYILNRENNKYHIKILDF